MTIPGFDSSQFKSCATSYSQLSICYLDESTLQKSPAMPRWAIGRFGVTAIVLSVATAILMA